MAKQRNVTVEADNELPVPVIEEKKNDEIVEKEPQQGVALRIIEAPYKFTDDELILLGEALSNRTNDLEHSKESQKAVMKEYKDEQRRISDDIKELTEQILTKERMKDFPCTIEKDYEKNVLNYIFEGKIMKSEPFGYEDMQTSLFDETPDASESSEMPEETVSPDDDVSGPEDELPN